MLQWFGVWDNSPTLITTGPALPPASDIDGQAGGYHFPVHATTRQLQSCESPILTTSGLDTHTLTASIGFTVPPWRGAGLALPSAEAGRGWKSSPTHMITGPCLPLYPSIAGCLRGVQMVPAHKVTR